MTIAAEALLLAGVTEETIGVHRHHIIKHVAADNTTSAEPRKVSSQPLLGNTAGNLGIIWFPLLACSCLASLWVLIRPFGANASFARCRTI